MVDRPPIVHALDPRRLACGDVDALLAFLRRLVAAGDDRFFLPHPFTHEAVSQLAETPCDDEYHVVHADREEEIVAYGMLRGWAEGYAVPSLGIAVDPARRGCGIGRRFLGFLHARALARGARTVRLTVHRGNERARALYGSSGYTFGPLAGDRLVGTLDLEPAPAVIRSRPAA